jgi:hypothetical protein
MLGPKPEDILDPSCATFEPTPTASPYAERAPVREGATRAVCPLWERLFDALPLAPVWVGAAVAGLLVAAFGLLDLVDGNLATALSGEVPFWRHVEVRSALVVSILLAGLVTTHRYEEVGSRGDLARLAPRLLPASDAAALEREVGSVHPRGLRLVGAGGALLLAAIVPALYLDPSRFLRAETWLLPSVLFDLGVGASLGWVSFRTLYAAIVQDLGFARLSQRVGEIDLFDLSPLAPFAGRGLRRALRWLFLVTVASLVFLDAGYVELPALLLALIVGFAAFSFLLPVRGIHRRIREEKGRALAALRAQIRAERRRVRARCTAGADAERGGGGHLADLLALETGLVAAREWPIDATTVLRLLLFALLPLGSWLGGAIVERIVSAALGG